MFAGCCRSDIVYVSTYVFVGQWSSRACSAWWFDVRCLRPLVTLRRHHWPAASFQTQLKLVLVGKSQSCCFPPISFLSGFKDDLVPFLLKWSSRTFTFPGGVLVMFRTESWDRSRSCTPRVWSAIHGQKLGMEWRGHEDVQHHSEVDSINHPLWIYGHTHPTSSVWDDVDDLHWFVLGPALHLGKCSRLAPFPAGNQSLPPGALLQAAAEKALRSWKATAQRQSYRHLAMLGSWQPWLGGDN